MANNRIAVSQSSFVLNITINSNLEDLTKAMETILSGSQFYDLLAKETTYQVPPLIKRHFYNRFTRGGKADGCPAWLPDSEATLDYESQAVSKSPDYTLPLVFTGHARGLLASKHSIYNPRTGTGNYNLIERGYIYTYSPMFPAYMIYHQTGYITIWKGKERKVPARPWFLWASVLEDNAGFNLFRRIARRLIQAYISNLFSFLARIFQAKVTSVRLK